MLCRRKSSNTSPTGRSGSPFGQSLQQLLFQDQEAMELLAEAATRLAQGAVQSNISAALALARLTALRKTDGGVRGMATGDVFRHFLGRSAYDGMSRAAFLYASLGFGLVASPHIIA